MLLKSIIVAKSSELANTQKNMAAVISQSGGSAKKRMPEEPKTAPTEKRPKPDGEAEDRLVVVLAEIYEFAKRLSKERVKARKAMRSKVIPKALIGIFY